MAGSNNIPERLSNFRIYNESNNLIGVATVDLPEISYMSDTVSGAGISGEIESPIAGHFQSMTCTINWRTIEPDAAGELLQNGVHTLDCRGSQRVYDAANNEYNDKAVRVMMKVHTKQYSMGSLEVGSTTDSSGEYEIYYIKVSYDGNEVLEIDKYNFVANINGNDELAKIREDIGM